MEPPGSPGWERHTGNIINDQKALNRALEAWDEGGCGPRPPGVSEWVNKPIPTPEDYQGNQTNSSTNSIGDYGELILLGGATVFLLLVPVDGPLGEATMGALLLKKLAQMHPAF